MPDVRIDHADGSTSTLGHKKHRAVYEFGEMDQLSVWVSREEANDADPREVQDDVALVVGNDDEFYGPLEDIVRDGKLVELIVNSPEQYGADSERTPPNEKWENVPDADPANPTDAPVTDAIEEVDEWDHGDVNEIESSISFIFAHSSQANKIRTVEGATSGEVKFHPNGDVDYVDEIGSTHNTTLSPANQSFEGDVEVSRQGHEERITHLTMLGTGEGPAQVSGLFVPEDDPYGYEAVSRYESYDFIERYDSDLWSDGDRKVWGTRSSNRITAADALETAGKAVIDEMNTEELSVECTTSETVELGDYFDIEYPEEGIDSPTQLRAVEVEWIWDAKGERWNVVFTNRQNSRVDPESKKTDDIEALNVGVQGNAVPINASGGRQPVDGTLNYYMEFYYPSEVVYEHRMNVRVMGLNYRYYAEPEEHSHNIDFTHSHDAQGHSHDFDATHSHDTQGHSHDFDATHSHNTEGHSHGVSTTSTDNSEFENVTTVIDESATMEVTDSWNTVDQYTDSTNVSQVWCIVQLINADTSGHTLQLRLHNSTDNEYIPDSGGWSLRDFPSEGSVCVTLPYSEDVGGAVGDSLRLEAQHSGSSSLEYNLNYSILWLGIGRHTHDVDTTTTDEVEVVEEELISDTTQSESEVVEEQLISDTTQNASEIIEERVITETTDTAPGVDAGIDETGDVPANCDILVNGSSMNVDFGDGSGPFQESVDIRGELIPGQVNSVEVTSDSLGHVLAFVEGDCYRQITGGG